MAEIKSVYRGKVTISRGGAIELTASGKCDADYDHGLDRASSSVPYESARLCDVAVSKHRENRRGE